VGQNEVLEDLNFVLLLGTATKKSNVNEPFSGIPDIQARDSCLLDEEDAGFYLLEDAIRWQRGRDRRSSLHIQLAMSIFVRREYN
jgi:hypothetical protein